MKPDQLDWGKLVFFQKILFCYREISFNIQHFCLTLVGEARIWYESLRPIKIEWIRLQNQFRQQYSKIGNTREQLFHAWRSFDFNENTETLVHMLQA